MSIGQKVTDKTQSSQDMLLAAAAKCLKRANGNQARAAEFLEEMALADRVLRDALTENILFEAARRVVQSLVSRTKQKQGWSDKSDVRAQQVFDQQVRSSRRVSTLIEESLMMFYLPGGVGKLLKDAQPDEVDVAAQWLENCSTTMARQGRWLRLVSAVGRAEATPTKRTIGEILTEQRLQSLQDQVLQTEVA